MKFVSPKSMRDSATRLETRRLRCSNSVHRTSRNYEIFLLQFAVRVCSALEIVLRIVVRRACIQVVLVDAQRDDVVEQLIRSGDTRTRALLMER